MYKFKSIKKPLNFKQAGDLFNSLSRLNELKILSEKDILNRFKFLQLSIRTNKDIFDLNPNTLDSPYLLGLNKKKLSRELNLSLLPSQKLSYSFGLFISTLQFKFKYKNIEILFFELSKLIINFLISIADTSLIIILSIIFVVKIKFKRVQNKNLNNIKEIYTIYFWKKKDKNSIEYYYPDFHNRKNSIAFASAFFQYKFLFIGLSNANKYKNICTALDFIEFNVLIKSLFQLVIVYLFDLRIFINPTFGSIIKYIQSLRYINRRLISLLNYNISLNILKLNSINYIYAWFENQACNKGLLFGWSKYLNYLNNKKNLKIFIYFGFLFTKRGLNQYKPSYSELLLSNYLTNNFLFQNNESANEMKSLFLRNKFNLKFSVVRNSLRKYIQGSENKNLIKKNIKRNFTIISSYEFNELSIICYGLIKLIKDKPFYQNKKIVFYIRLHPTLNSDKTLIRLIDFAKVNNLKLPHIEFINNEKETLMTSIKNTNYAIFGHTPLINLALSNGVKVIAFRTNFLSQPPIYEKYLKCKLIDIVN